jgi:hypothetical protein
VRFFHNPGYEHTARSRAAAGDTGLVTMQGKKESG